MLDAKQNIRSIEKNLHINFLLHPLVKEHKSSYGKMFNLQWHYGVKQQTNEA